MSVIKNIVLTLIVILSLIAFAVGAILVWVGVDGMANTHLTITSAFSFMAGLMLMGFVLWAFPYTIITTPLKAWVDENNKCTAPAVHIGHSMWKERHELMTMGLKLEAGLDELEDMLKDEQAKYARAIRKGELYVRTNEAKIHKLEEEILFLRGVITNLSNTIEKQEKSLSFYRTLNWADRTHVRLVK